MKTRNVARAVILTAIAVALSPFFIPVGISKCFPAQHMVNVLSAVMLGRLMQSLSPSWRRSFETSWV